MAHRKPSKLLYSKLKLLESWIANHARLLVLAKPSNRNSVYELEEVSTDCRAPNVAGVRRDKRSACTSTSRISIASIRGCICWLDNVLESLVCDTRHLVCPSLISTVYAPQLWSLRILFEDASRTGSTYGTSMGAIQWGTGGKIRQLGVQDRSLVLCILVGYIPCVRVSFLIGQSVSSVLFSRTAKPASR